MGIVRGVLWIICSALRLASISEHANLATIESRNDQLGPTRRGGHINNQFQARLLRFLIIVTVTSREDGIKVEPHKIVMIMSRGDKGQAGIPGAFSAPFKIPLSPSLENGEKTSPTPRPPFCKWIILLGSIWCGIVQVAFQSVVHYLCVNRVKWLVQALCANKAQMRHLGLLGGSGDVALVERGLNLSG